MSALEALDLAGKGLNAFSVSFYLPFALNLSDFASPCRPYSSV
jgi:hypothetical protein